MLCSLAIWRLPRLITLPLLAANIPSPPLTHPQEMMQRALNSRLKILGEEHSDTVVSLNNLASLLFQQGKTAEAVPLYKQ